MPIDDIHEKRRYQREWVWRKRQGLETRTKPLLSDVFTKKQIRQHRDNIVKRSYHKKRHEITNHVGDLCAVCGAPARNIHRKDGRKHEQFIKTPWDDLHDVMRLTLKHYVPLCQSCHANIHKYMRQTGISWQEAARLVKRDKIAGLDNF